MEGYIVLVAVINIICSNEEGEATGVGGFLFKCSKPTFFSYIDILFLITSFALVVCEIIVQSKRERRDLAN